MAIEFVHAADGMDTRAVFYNARAVGEAGRAVVAGAGNNFAQTVAHLSLFQTG